MAIAGKLEALRSLDRTDHAFARSQLHRLLSQGLLQLIERSIYIAAEQQTSAQHAPAAVR